MWPRRTVHMTRYLTIERKLEVGGFRQPLACRPTRSQIPYLKIRAPAIPADQLRITTTARASSSGPIQLTLLRKRVEMDQPFVRREAVEYISYRS